MKLNKKAWTPVEFGDVTRKVNNKIDPISYNSDIVIKGEHINKCDFRIREYENKKTLGYLGPAFHMGFSQHQTLYVSRNPHLIKVGYATFDGICANTTFIIESKNEGILRNDLIPFIMLSNNFIEHSVNNSRGSVNPYVNWKDISDMKFSLPTIHEQEQLSELLWAANDVIETSIQLKAQLERLRDVNREKLYTYGLSTFSTEEACSGTSIKKSNVHFKSDEIKFFDCVDIKSGQVDPTAEEYSSLFQIGSERIEANTGRITTLKTAKELNISSGNYLFTEEDIIYSKIRPYFKKVAIPNFKGLCSADIYPLRVKSDKVIKEYLFYFMLTEKFTRELLRFQNRTGMPKVNREELGAMKVPVPSIEEQNEIVKILKTIDNSIAEVTEKIRISREKQQSLINQVF